MGGLKYRMGRGAKEFVIKAAGLRWEKWASSKRRRRRMLIDEPAVVAYLEGRPGPKAVTEMIQQLMATGQITSERDLKRNSFLLRRLVMAEDAPSIREGESRCVGAAVASQEAAFHVLPNPEVDLRGLLHWRTTHEWSFVLPR